MVLPTYFLFLEEEGPLEEEEETATMFDVAAVVA